MSTRSAVLAALVVIGAGLVGVLGHQSSAFSSSPSPAAAGSPSPGSPERLQAGRHGGLSAADGVVPDHVTVFDDRYPAVTRLDADLRSALRRAARAAGGDGIELYVNSGWRSAAYQRQLLDDAVSRYGSAAEAARWVATPHTSAHVTGDAVDLGPTDARGWLTEHGATYGLCQIYGDEPWHYELRPDAVDGGCPDMYAAPTHDPRMQR